jgi:hypothetical protein
VIAMILCAVLYVGLQRYYIRGLTSGVVKGLTGPAEPLDDGLVQG